MNIMFTTLVMTVITHTFILDYHFLPSIQTSPATDIAANHVTLGKGFDRI